MTTMKAVVFDEIGDPVSVLKLAEKPVPEIGDNEALVKLTAASINPGDFLFIQNLYPEPKKPVFPQQTGGFYGAGIVARAGRNVRIPEGSHVAFGYYNAWADYAAVPQDWLIPLPADYAPEKAAQLFNLFTAWDLLAQTKTQAGQWLAVTGGNSTVSAMIFQLARQRGIRVIAIVRRRIAAVALEKLGVETVIETNDLPADLSGGIGTRIAAITGGKGLAGVIDCVGGPLLSGLVKAMALNGQAVIYGGYSSETFALHNFDILMSGVTLGSYIYRYFFTPPTPEQAAEHPALIAASAGADFWLPFGGWHRLEDFRTAIGETAARPEAGKRFFSMG